MKRIHSYKFFLESQDSTLLKKPSSTSASDGTEVVNKNVEFYKNIDWKKSMDAGALYTSNGKKLEPPKVDMSGENAIDLTINAISTLLDTIPSGVSQLASFAIDILHACSFIYRWKQAQKDEDKWYYFVVSIIMVLSCWIPRAGNLISKKLLQGKSGIKQIILQSIKNWEKHKSKMAITQGSKTAWILVNSAVTFLVQNGLQDQVRGFFPTIDQVKSRISEAKKDSIYKLALGKYDEQIEEMIAKPLSLYSEIYRHIEKSLEIAGELKATA
jgi:hypothetical protein